MLPITVDARSGIFGSNPTEGVDFCFHPYVLCPRESTLKSGNILCVLPGMQGHRKKSKKPEKTCVSYSKSVRFESDTATVLIETFHLCVCVILPDELLFIVLK